MQMRRRSLPSPGSAAAWALGHQHHVVYTSNAPPSRVTARAWRWRGEIRSSAGSKIAVARKRACARATSVRVARRPCLSCAPSRHDAGRRVNAPPHPDPVHEPGDHPKERGSWLVESPSKLDVV